ncbi:MAG TPA: DUF1015 domain-containing protein [Clostridiales bacterium]|nr:DUF1015 domain-containing protein [Clostridiales bacterium]
MARIEPFRGLRYNQEKITDLIEVTTPPYDVISPEMQDKYYSLSPYNIIRLELGKEYPQDNESNNKYTRAAQLFEEWKKSNILIKEDKPSIYIYQQVFTLNNNITKTRTGIICGVELVDFSRGIVLPHEFTLSKPKTDRYNLMHATNANFSQIFSLYEDPSKTISDIINKNIKNVPVIDMVDEEGIRNRVWTIDKKEEIETIKETLKNKQLFIADGHHRYETALAYKNDMALANKQHTGNEPYNFVMMMLVDMNDPGLVILPTHRMVKNLDGWNFERFLQRLKENFHVEKYPIISIEDNNIFNEIEEKLYAKGKENTTMAFYGGNGGLYFVSLKSREILDNIQTDMSYAYRNLDVTILHTLILDNILGIDKEKLVNQDNVFYTRSIKEAIKEVERGNYQISFILNATKIDEMKQVALHQEKMPQKSTYFYPKLLTGLVINDLK